MEDNLVLPKELFGKSVILEKKTDGFVGDPFYTVIMSSDDRFKVRDKVDLSNGHQIIKRMDNGMLIVNTEYVYGKY